MEDDPTTPIILRPASQHLAELGLSMAEAVLLVARDGNVNDKIREWSSLIGIVTAIVGNVLISFALNIQRYAHIRLDREKDHDLGESNNGVDKTKVGNYGTQQSEIAEERAQLNLSSPFKDHDDAQKGLDGIVGRKTSIHSRSSSEVTIKHSEKSRPENGQTYLSSPYWWGGILLMTIGEAGNFLAYGFAPASIVSPLGVVALVSNCIIAPLLLKERFRLRDGLGVVVAVAGAVTVVLSAKNTEMKMGPHKLWAAITRWEFELYLATTAVLIFLLMWASGKYGQKTILIDLGLVGLFGGYTALSTKGVASLLSDTLWRAFTFPVMYLLIFILVLTAVLQIRYVNRALQRFNSTQVIPTQFVLFTISVIIGSAILYRDFESATLDRVAKFIGGCLLTFLGVYLITSGREGDTEGEGEDIDDEENAIGLVDEERYQDETENISEEDARARRQSSLSITFDQPPKASRRPSHQPRRSSQPRTPQRLLSNASSTHSRPLSRQSHDSASPLLGNPWQPSNSLLAPASRPRPLENTISSPLLPSEAQRSNPSTPQAQGPRRLSAPRSDRPSTLSRPSMARLTPAPLMSPLSSSLSAVVADSLRRGVNPRRRPNFSSMRKSRSQRTGEDSSVGDTAIESSPLKPTDSPTATGPSRHPGRSQSVTATLGEFFRLKKSRSKSTYDEESDTEGPERETEH